MSYLNSFYKNEDIAQFSEIVEILLFFFLNLKILVGLVTVFGKAES